MSDFAIDEITKEFLVESYENLDQLDRDLVVLEKDPHSEQTIASIFRTVHALKGTSGFLGFEKLEDVAHEGENLLSKLRDKVFGINPEITNALPLLRRKQTSCRLWSIQSRAAAWGSSSVESATSSRKPSVLSAMPLEMGFLARW
jgi:chemotaxis protein histidine kinase CheA